MDKRFDEVDKRFDSLSADVISVKDELLAKIEELNTSFHRQEVLSEEQNSKTGFVLDGYQQIYHRQDILDNRMLKIEKNNTQIALKLLLKD